MSTARDRAPARAAIGAHVRPRVETQHRETALALRRHRNV